MSGGTFVGETWEWNGQWQQRSATSGTNGYALFDRTRGRVVAYSRWSSGPTQCVEWDGSSWNAITPPTGVDPLYGVGAAYDPIRDRELLYGLFDFTHSRALHVVGQTPAAVEDLGGSCNPEMPLTIEGLPRIGRTATVATSATPNTWSLVAFAPQSTPMPFGACTIFVDGSLGVYWRFSAPSGRVDLPITIPNDLGLRGFSFAVQTATLVGSLTALSRGLRIRVGD